MSTPVEKLLVLKAYYLGHAINEKKVVQPTALAMINAAIEFHAACKDSQDRLRFFFYILLKSEVLRGSDESIALRKKAMSLSQDIAGNPYTDYMAIEEATQTPSKAYGIQQGVIGNKGVTHRKEFVYFTSVGPAVGIYDSALRSVGLDESDISEREHRFLYKTNLKELLDKHNVPFTL